MTNSIPVGTLDQMVLFDLEQPRTADMPIHPTHRPGYSYTLYRRHEDKYRPEELGPRTSASGMIICMEHSGTHIDALAHQADSLTLFGNVPVDSQVQTPAGFTRHGAEEIPPIIAPGVLLDPVAALGLEALEPGYAVTAADLEACCDRQKVTVEPGDVLLVRTGNGRYWNDSERYLAGPGMAGSAARWAAERQVLAVGADNMAWDVVGLWDEDLGCYLPAHLLLLARRGIYIIENMQLEELAAAGRDRFTFICIPPKFAGATGAPVRPLALVSS